MGGPTNFHTAFQLLSRAGSTFELQAMIEHFHRPVYVSYTSIPQEVVDKYLWCLSCGHLDQWVSRSTDPLAPMPVHVNTTAPDPFRIAPKAIISPALAGNPYSNERDDQVSQIDFVLIIEGLSGATQQKLVVAHARHDASATIFHEAINGYSVVFSGAVPKTVTRSVFIHGGVGRNVMFRKVATLEELLGVYEQEPDYKGRMCQVVPILC
jgi:hypothetical protein